MRNKEVLERNEETLLDHLISHPADFLSQIVLEQNRVLKDLVDLAERRVALRDFQAELARL